MSTASHIKSKANRLSVMGALKKIQQHLKLYKQKCPENGLALFVHDDLTWIIPPQPIKKFIYTCDKQFHTQTLFDLYQTHDQYGVILISGSCCLMYTLTSIDFKLIYKTHVSLQSRQKKGGQSAVRISRIAEEKRHLYLKQIVDQINQLFIEDHKTNVKSFIIAGSAEMKDHLIKSELLDYRIKPLILHVLTIDNITNETIYKIIDLNLFNQVQLSQEEELCQHIINHIDDYIYGLEEIQKYIDYHNCECVYVHHTVHFDYKKCHHFIIIKSDHHYGQLLCQYGGVILKPYYIMDDIKDL